MWQSLIKAKNITLCFSPYVNAGQSTEAYRQHGKRLIIYKYKKKNIKWSVYYQYGQYSLTFRALALRQREKYYPYRQYTDHFIFRFVSLLRLRSTLRLLKKKSLLSENLTQVDMSTVCYGVQYNNNNLFLVHHNILNALTTKSRIKLLSLIKKEIDNIQS